MTCTADTREPVLTTRSFRAIGTTATVVVQDPAAADWAERALAADLEALDLACSRFREDSELQMLHANAGRPVEVGESALRGARRCPHRGRADRRGGRPDHRQCHRGARLRR